MRLISDGSDISHIWFKQFHVYWQENRRHLNNTIMEALHQDVFEKLGNLFYAMAKDQDILRLGFGELQMLMQKDWLGNHETPVPVPESTHLIITTLDSLQAEGTSSEQAFSSFMEFYKAHMDLFSEKLKDEILNTANEIVRMFTTANRRQNNQIIKLKLLLQNSLVL